MKKLLLIILVLFAGILTPDLSNAQSTQPIRIEIPDVVINQTKLKCKAELFTMTYNQAFKYLTLSWNVSYYADSAGHYGQPISLNGISSYTKESIANNTVMVNPLTGAFVEKDAEGNYPPGSVGQYDFFYNLAENHDINVHDLIRAYGAAVTSW